MDWPPSAEPSRFLLAWIRWDYNYMPKSLLFRRLKDFPVCKCRNMPTKLRELRNFQCLSALQSEVLDILMLTLTARTSAVAPTSWRSSESTGQELKKISMKIMADWIVLAERKYLCPIYRGVSFELVLTERIQSRSISRMWGSKWSACVSAKYLLLILRVWARFNI